MGTTDFTFQINREARLGLTHQIDADRHHHLFTDPLWRIAAFGDVEGVAGNVVVGFEGG